MKKIMEKEDMANEKFAISKVAKDKKLPVYKKREDKELDNVEWIMLWASMRYFCNRGTIASATYPADVIKYYYHRLTNQQKQSLVDDLEREAQYNNNFFGHADCDNEAWQKFRYALDENKHFKVKGNDNNIYTVFELFNKYYCVETYLKEPWRETYIPKENVIENYKTVEEKTVYVLTSNGDVTYYKTMNDLYKDYVSQDHISEMIVNEDEYKTIKFEYD